MNFIKRSKAGIEFGRYLIFKFLIQMIPSSPQLAVKHEIVNRLQAIHSEVS